MDLFFDIETCPDLRDGAMQRCIDAVEPPGQYKKPESIAEWKASNAANVGAEQWSRTALDALCGGIYVIGFAVDDRAPQILSRELDVPEASFLASALATINSQVDDYGQHRLPRFVGWNVIGFDIPFIAKRCAIHGITPALRLPTGTRYNNERVLDLMIAWSDFKDFNKQRDVAAAMGIPLIDETDGKQLWQVVQQQGISAATKKCESDIDALRQIYRRMQPVFEL